MLFFSHESPHDMPFFRFPLLTLCLALALGLTACEPRDDRTAVGTADTPATDTDPMATDPMAPGTTGEASVEETNRTLEGGVTNIPVNAALSTIDGWIHRLDDQDFQRRDEIVSGLRELRTALQESPIDGSRVGGIMANLGDHTQAAGADANHAQVQRLGQLLQQSAERLRGAQATPETGAAPATGATPGAATEPGTQGTGTSGY